MQNTYILPYCNSFRIAIYLFLIKQYSDILLKKSAVYLSELSSVFSKNKLWESKQNHGSQPLYN